MRENERESEREVARTMQNNGLYRARDMATVTDRGLSCMCRSTHFCQSAADRALARRWWLEHIIGCRCASYGQWLQHIHIVSRCCRSCWRRCCSGGRGRTGQHCSLILVALNLDNETATVEHVVCRWRLCDMMLVDQHRPFQGRRLGNAASRRCKGVIV